MHTLNLYEPPFRNSRSVATAQGLLCKVVSLGTRLVGWYGRCPDYSYQSLKTSHTYLSEEHVVVPML